MLHRQGSVTRMCLARFVAAGLALAVAASAYAQAPVVPPGSGTEADPYLISELGHLVWMGDTAAASSGKYYSLTTDIDASVTAGWNDAGTDTTIPEGFKPIGTYSSPDTTSFRGIFDGNGHTISGLAINRPGTNDVGLFGYIGSGGQVRNLSLVSGVVTGSYRVGGLVGYNYSGTVSNCYATGTVTGNARVSGLVGYNSYGTVSNCYATGAVTGTWEVGGLVGYNDSGTVSNCYATGAVTGTWDVGGLVGENYSSSSGGTVSNCYATGAVLGTWEVGGLVGYNYYGTVSNCYATGAVTGEENVGGLVGFNYGTVSNCCAIGTVTGNEDVGGLVGRSYSGTVSNCYATGAVMGTGYRVGGLVGFNYGTVSNCYATGAVTGTGYRVGGLVGYNFYGTVSSSYWDMQTSGQSTSAGGTGKTTAEMKQQATFIGWDFTSIWGIVENVTYPFFLSEPQAPVLTAAFSRKTHGTAGEFDIDLRVAGATECRSGGPTRIVATFSDPIQLTLGNSSVSVISGAVAGLSPSGSQLAIDLQGAVEHQPLVVGFPGVASAANAAFICGSTLCFTVQLGDANQDRSTTIFDLVAMRNVLNTVTNSSTFRMDVNADGNISIFDLIVARNNLNTAAAECP